MLTFTAYELIGLLTQQCREISKREIIFLTCAAELREFRP